MSVIQPETMGPGDGNLRMFRGYSTVMSQDPDLDHDAGLSDMRAFALDLKDKGITVGAEADWLDALVERLLADSPPGSMTAQDLHEVIRNAAEAGIDGDLIKGTQILRDAMPERF